MSEPNDNQRVMPHSIEAEQGLLGSMLIAPAEVMDDCAQRIKAEAFYQPTHQTIFALLVELWDKQQPADLITLTQALAGEAELIVAKQRRGPIGPIKLTFRKEFCRFDERAEEPPVHIRDLYALSHVS